MEWELVGFISLMLTFIGTTKITLKELKKGNRSLSKLIRANHEYVLDELRKIKDRISILEQINLDREPFDKVVKTVVNNCEQALLIKSGAALDKIQQHRTMKLSGGVRHDSKKQSNDKSGKKRSEK